MVASRIGSLEEIVENEKTGFLFPPKDADALANELRKFIEDGTLSGRLGKNARKKCEEEYNEAIHMKKVIACLNSGRTGGRKDTA